MKIIIYLLIFGSSIKYYQLQTDEGQTFQETALEEIRENELEDTQCNKDLLLDFNLNGYDYVQQETHQFCPYININCCTNEDQNFSMYMWNTKHKLIFENKIQRYMRALKYLFGFVDQINSYANYAQNSKDQYCRQASKIVQDNNLSPNIVKEIVQKIQQTKENVANIRKGFQCILCDGKTHMQTFNNDKNNSNQKIKISLDFCKKLVSETVETSFIRLHYFVGYLESFSILNSCKNFEDSTHALFYVANKQTREITNQCTAFKDTEFNQYCMSYCNQFSLNMENPLIDGSFGSLIPYIEYFIKNRSYFNHQTSHIFYQNLNLIEKQLKQDVKKYQNDIYLKSQTEKIIIQAQTEYTEGIENYDQAKDNMYFISLSYNKILIIGSFLILIFNQVNDNNLK